MKRRVVLISLIVLGLLSVPLRCPAPLVYRPGEGWTYESVGGGKWVRARAKDQLEVAQEAFDNKQYGVAKKAARRTVKRWPLSDYAPQAQYLLGRVYEARRYDQRAFKEYQKLIEKYPKAADYDAVLQRQYEIANRFLGGQWFKLWGFIPFFRSMEKTADMFTKVVQSGPHSAIAPDAQLKIGAAREKQKEYMLAVKAYEKAADIYHNRPKIAAEAIYRAGMAYRKAALTAEYDQSAAASAIATFTDLITLYPDDSRVADVRGYIRTLKTEQARGAFQTARFYEKKRQWDGAKVYYNEAVSFDPESTYAIEAKRRLETVARHSRAKTASAPTP
ncbi:MAG: outer membrane protein assembly factor BamD [Verrucomicrobia bacterium]|jgi:outer membrane protein assembly factor BamD|nr:outer membrane protein assembly factor BamD [Verrucomicrobiota bacterium]OQC65584.1 MAG: Outer membrane protein assembly factor BamD [Verrucomicrobia bacterium ADurb.Bin006]MDI9380520.1 outer membrane protein assembly factor BamD [Verrucomicrobiota bacterium]NMD22148.1 outer membrane protein assembly factor BamD [Verrucomicrobiota bacterium]HNU99836.1 outer membrane protein assembly factor BamD [Verrucomicrobiota bacterium]